MGTLDPTLFDAKAAEAQLWLQGRPLPEDDAEDSDISTERAKITKDLEFFLSGTSFISLLESLSPKLELLLRTGGGDTVETLRFFVKAAHFSLPCAAKGLRSSWSLIWSNESIVKEAVLEAFAEVYLAKGEAKSYGKVATNLINVVAASDHRERSCLEEVLSLLVKAESIDQKVFAALIKAALEVAFNSHPSL